MLRSLAVHDISQTVGRTGARYDGQLPTVATTSKLLVMRTGEVLSAKHLAPMFGLPPDVDFSGQTHAAALKMLGNCMHQADVGVVLGIALLLKMGLLK